MRGETHALVTALVAVPVLWQLTGQDAGATLGGSGVAVLGALWPDVDHAGSTLARSGRLLTRAPARVLQAITGHRGLCHSLAGAALWTALLAWALSLWAGPGGIAPAALCFAAGYVGGHLALDALTPAGVPLLWPRGRRFGPRFRFWRAPRRPRRGSRAPRRPRWAR